MSVAGGSMDAMTATIPVDELLEFEETHPRHSGRKEDEIRARFGLAPARYYQLLHRAAVSIEGQSRHPLTSHRVLRRLARG